jgi:nitrate reductase beta subunit
MLAGRQLSDTLSAPPTKAQRVNLLNWDGKGAPQGLFPERPGTAGEADGGGVHAGDAGSVEPRP